MNFSTFSHYLSDHKRKRTKRGKQKLKSDFYDFGQVTSESQGLVQLAINMTVACYGETLL